MVDLSHHRDITKPILVTGASGHLGYTIAKLLVDRGYKVRASVRDSKNPNKIAHLEKLGVEIVELDISDLEQFKNVSKEVQAIFHVAAVFKFGLPDPEETIIKPIVEGALNSIRAAKHNKVPRLIYTSSTVTLGPGGNRENPYNESSWYFGSEIPYQKGKAIAEQKAWELSKELQVNMVSIIPGMILGPYFSQLSSSVNVVGEIVDGKIPAIPKFGSSAVDVRDVAEAHILAFEKNDARGRYIVTSATPSSMESIIKVLHAEDSSIKVPSIKMPRWAFITYARVSSFFAKLIGKVPQITTQQAKEYTEGRYVDNTRVQKELGLTFHPVEDAIIDTMKWMKNPDFEETGKQIIENVV